MQAWLTLVFVELLASSEGIGYLMVWGRQLAQLDLVVVGMLVIGAVGVALDLVLRTLEARVQRWRVAAY
jgi:sulfonate transport system permease protein